jgi:large subunit ribosomal protein L29
MKASEIRELNDADLTARIAELEEERFRLRFRGATETLEDPLRLRLIRRDVARMKTILREREREAAGAPGGAHKSAAKRASAGRKTAARKARASATRTTKASAKRTTTGKRAAGAGER